MAFGRLARWIVALMLVGSGAAQTPVPAGAGPATMHVVRSSTTLVVNGVHELRLWGVIGGQKVELVYLSGGLVAPEMFVIAPGDYAVKVTEDKKTDRGIVRRYDIEVAPGKHVTFALVGLAE